MDREVILDKLCDLFEDDVPEHFSTIEKIADWHIAEIEKANRDAKLEILKEIDKWVEKDPKFPDVHKYIVPNPSNLKWLIQQKLKESEGK
jgi:hypothetical protein